MNGWDGRPRRPDTSVRTKTARRLRQSMTPQEVKVWNWLRQRLHPMGYKFRRQVSIGPYVADFASLRPKLVIEIDGDSHYDGAAAERDEERDRYIIGEGFAVLRFNNHEIDRSGHGVLERIVGSLTSQGHPTP